MAIFQNQFREASYFRNVWCATVEHGVEPEDLFAPEFWAHVAGNLKPGDRIEVMPDSREWYAELMVMDAGKLYARVKPMRLVMFTEAAKTSDADFSVVWKGPAAKWCVVRTADSAIMYRDMSSKDAAEAKLAEHKQPKAA